MEKVCPARAGMIRGDINRYYVGDGLPRTRGDDPALNRLAMSAFLFAPHARG